MGTGGLFSGAIVIMAYCCKYHQRNRSIEERQILDSHSVIQRNEARHLLQKADTSSASSKPASCFWIDWGYVGNCLRSWTSPRRRVYASGPLQLQDFSNQHLVTESAGDGASTSSKYLSCSRKQS